MGLRGNVRLLLVCLTVAACGSSPPGKTFYQRNIEPVLLQNCARGTSGCHQANDTDPYKFAAGNFDVTSFVNVQKRRDLLAPFGAYPYPLLLIKAVAPALPDPMDPNKLFMQYGSDFVGIDVLHAGGSIIEVGSSAFTTLQTWIENGATENGVAPPTPAQTGNGTCSTAVPSGFNPAMYQANANYNTFKTNVQPIFTKHGCVSSNCHGAPQSDFYITCGNDDTQLAFNFSQAWSFVNNPVEDSQILRVPLAVGAGGRGHTGGDQFASTDDPDYATIRDWATAVGVLDFAMGDPVKQFFKDNVQPILLRRGCSFEACHSPMATNDFKLRSGTQGFFSAISLEKNYELLKDNFMALEFPDVRRGRAIAKTVLTLDYRLPSVGGISHRAGSVLETPDDGPADPTACGAFNAMTSTPFCTIQEWINEERAAISTQVTSMNMGDPINIVYVERTPGSASAGRLEFDTFQGNADLKAAATTFAAGQTLNPADAGAAVSLLTNCAGTTPGQVDVQAPDVANDGVSVAFAMRRSASEPLTIWTVQIDGSNCKQVMPAQADSNGIKVHDFDPAWSPDGTYIVFASTRGKAGYGASLTRKRFLPQSDLWRIKLADSTVDQMTFLSNSEISPQFMREGRVTMSTEKVSDGFYQVAGRRINWDLTDYHPLLGQRNISLYADLTDLTQTKPSIAHDAVTDVREGNDGNFMIILSDVDPTTGKPILAGGAGALAIFNRSIGPFETGRTDPGYFQSVTVLDSTAATGTTGATSGYRGPFYLPDGTIMVSYTNDLTALNWDIVSIDPRTSARTNLFSNGGGKVRVDAVLAYKYPPRDFYLNRRQLVFGGSSDPSDPAHATLHMPDAPMVFTVLTGNLRRGRPVEAFRGAKFLVVESEGMCPAGTSCAANTNGVFQQRTVLGKAALAGDGSLRVQLPAATGIVMSLQDASGNTIVKMSEEHQLGPGESISMGVQQPLFDAVCGGCHGSVTGQEIDIAVTADALTGASSSASATASPTSIGP